MEIIKQSIQGHHHGLDDLLHLPAIGLHKGDLLFPLFYSQLFLFNTSLCVVVGFSFHYTLFKAAFKQDEGAKAIRTGHGQHGIFEPSQVIDRLVVEVADDDKRVHTFRGINLYRGVCAHSKKNRVWQVQNRVFGLLKQVWVELSQ